MPVISGAKIKSTAAHTSDSQQRARRVLLIGTVPVFMMELKSLYARCSALPRKCKFHLDCSVARISRVFAKIAIATLPSMLKRFDFLAMSTTSPTIDIWASKRLLVLQISCQFHLTRLVGLQGIRSWPVWHLRPPRCRNAHQPGLSLSAVPCCRSIFEGSFFFMTDVNPKAVHISSVSSRSSVKGAETLSTFAGGGVRSHDGRADFPRPR